MGSNTSSSAAQTGLPGAAGRAQAALEGALQHLAHVALAAAVSAVWAAVMDPAWLAANVPVLARYTGLVASLSTLFNFGHGLVVTKGSK